MPHAAGPSWRHFSGPAREDPAEVQRGQVLGPCGNRCGGSGPGHPQCGAGCTLRLARPSRGLPSQVLVTTHRHWSEAVQILLVLFSDCLPLLRRWRGRYCLSLVLNLMTICHCSRGGEAVQIRVVPLSEPNDSLPIVHKVERQCRYCLSLSQSVHLSHHDSLDPARGFFHNLHTLCCMPLEVLNLNNNCCA